MIILINPPVFEGRRHILNNMQEPFTLLQLGAVLEQAGFKVRIIDYNIRLFNEEELKGIIQKERPLFIGLTMLAIHKPAIKIISDNIRTIYKGKIIVGGVQASISPLEVLKENKVDIAVRGEGDRTIEELARALQKGESLEGIAGISYNENGRIYENGERELIADLDSLPFPARHLVKMADYRWRYWGIRVWGMMAGRGCPFHCYYCSKLFGDKVRLRRAARVIEEMTYLNQRYGTKGFLFHDDTFTLRSDWANEFLDRLLASGLNVRFRCHTRVNTATSELLKKLYRAGCRGIDFGIETADPDLSRLIRKGIDLKRVKEAVRWGREANLEVMGNFMIGFPADDHETVRKTILFAAGVPFSFINVSIVTPYPGTALYDSLSLEEKGKLDFGRFRQSAPEFFCQRYEEYDPIYVIPNKNLTRQEILHYYQLMPIYFFSHRAVKEIVSFVPGFLKLIFLWLIKRQSFKEALAVAFPSSRSMILAVARAFRQKKGINKVSYLGKLAKIIILKGDYLYGRRIVFKA